MELTGRGNASLPACHVTEPDSFGNLASREDSRDWDTSPNNSPTDFEVKIWRTSRSQNRLVRPLCFVLPGWDGIRFVEGAPMTTRPILFYDLGRDNTVWIGRFGTRTGIGETSSGIPTIVCGA